MVKIILNQLSLNFTFYSQFQSKPLFPSAEGELGRSGAQGKPREFRSEEFRSLKDEWDQDLGTGSQGRENKQQSWIQQAE